MPTYQRPRAQITITEKDENGRERVAIAVRGDPTQPNRWDLKHTLPNGQLFDGSFFGLKAEVPLALQQMLSRTENQFRADAGRGDRPPQHGRTGPSDRYIALPDAPVFKTGR